jgi:hypothetical protein
VKYHQEYYPIRTGLGYQISVYMMMRSLEEMTQLEWDVDKGSLSALSNTFSNLNLNVCNKDIEYKDVTFLTPFTDFINKDFDDIDDIAKKIEYNSELFGYPLPVNFIKDYNLFLQIKNELKFREDIVEKCKSFKKQFDSEVIALHFRGGDFSKLENTTFVCGIDYYQNALKELPKDIPILIFTNEKDSPIISELISIDPNRFTLITDLFNNNNFIDCKIGNELDQLIDNNSCYKFDYKYALIDIAKTRLENETNHSKILKEVSKIAKELNPIYREKLKTQSYNYSYDFCLMSMCDYIIMSNSIFSMWAAELGDPKKVMYPKYWIQNHDEDTFIKRDLNGYDQAKDMFSGILDKPYYFGLDNKDSRTLTIVSEVSKLDNDGYFYKESNVIPEELLSDLYDSTIDWLETTRKSITKETYPPEASSELWSIPEFVNQPIWKNFYSIINKHVERYCNNSGIDFSKIKTHSAWINRIADLEFYGQNTREELRFRLKHHISIGDMHSHDDNPIGVVYYFKNPDPKYGTAVKLSEDKIFHSKGEENSLMIFDPRLYHTALYPPLEKVTDHPRIVIVTDYCYE